MYPDGRNEYQLFQSTYPSALPPDDHSLYSSGQPTSGPSQPTYSPVEDAQPQYFQERAILDTSAYQKEENFGHGGTISGNSQLANPRAYINHCEYDHHDPDKLISFFKELPVNGDRPPHIESDEIFTSLGVLEPTESAVTTSPHIGAASSSLVPVAPVVLAHAKTFPLAPVASFTYVAPLPSISVAPPNQAALSAKAVSLPVAPSSTAAPVAPVVPPTLVAPLATMTPLVLGASLLAQVALRDPAAPLAPDVPSAPLVVQVPLTPQAPQQLSRQFKQHFQVQPPSEQFLYPSSQPKLRPDHPMYPKVVSRGDHSFISFLGLVCSYLLTCSDLLSYGVVLASISITIASTSTDYDLWYAFKGGTNIFGIVTRLTQISLSRRLLRTTTTPLGPLLADSMTMEKRSSALKTVINTNRISLDTTEWVERGTGSKD